MGSGRFGWLGWNEPQVAAGALGVDKEPGHCWGAGGSGGPSHTALFPQALWWLCVLSGSEQGIPVPTREHRSDWELGTSGTRCAARCCLR